MAEEMRTRSNALEVAASAARSRGDTSDVHSTLTDKQKRAVRWLAGKRDGYLDRSAVVQATSLTDFEYDRLMHYLERRGCIEIVPVDDAVYASDLNVTVGILQVVRELDTPPAKDYPQLIKAWFFSKPWSVPFWILAVVLPALLGYVTMLKSVLTWFGWKR